jgi:hypothetical protein
MLGSLSHIVNHSTLGYQALPDFPAEAPDPSVRSPNEVSFMTKDCVCTLTPTQEKWDLSAPLQSPRGKKESFWSTSSPRPFSSYFVALS